MYAIVNFTKDNSVEVVPSSWCISERLCKWPSKGTKSSDITRMIKNGCDPEQDWMDFAVKIYRRTETYGHARELCSKAEVTSDLGTDDPDKFTGRGKRKKRNIRRFDESSEQESEDCSDDSTTSIRPAKKVKLSGKKDKAEKEKLTSKRFGKSLKLPKPPVYKPNNPIPEPIQEFNATFRNSRTADQNKTTTNQTQTTPKTVAEDLIMASPNNLTADLSMTVPKSVSAERQTTVPKTVSAERQTTVPKTVSAERQTTVPKTVSAERQTTVPKTVSAERQTTVPKTVSAERQTTVPKTVSAERQTTVPKTVSAERQRTVLENIRDDFLGEEVSDNRHAQDKGDAFEPCIDDIPKDDSNVPDRNDDDNELSYGLQEIRAPHQSVSFKRSTKSRALSSDNLSQEKFQKAVFRMLSDLNDKVDKILTNQHLENEDLSCSAQNSEFPNFPLTSIDDLNDFEEFVENKENYKKAVAYLGGYGGKKVSDTTRRILKTVLAQEVVLKMNWNGRNEKISFQNLRLRNIVIDAVRKTQKLKHTKEFEVETVMKTWIKHAKDRYGGRGQRNNNRRSEENRQQLTDDDDED